MLIDEQIGKDVVPFPGFDLHDASVELARFILRESCLGLELSDPGLRFRAVRIAVTEFAGDYSLARLRMADEPNRWERGAKHLVAENVIAVPMGIDCDRHTLVGDLTQALENRLSCGARVARVDHDDVLIADDERGVADRISAGLDRPCQGVDATAECGNGVRAAVWSLPGLRPRKWRCQNHDQDTEDWRPHRH